MRELVRLRDAAKRFEDAGISVIVASTDTAENAKEGAARFELPFPIVTDADGLLMDRTGLRHKGQGPGGKDVFYATLFLVDRKGVVRWRFTPERLNHRATPDEILAAASEIGSDG